VFTKKAWKRPSGLPPVRSAPDEKAMRVPRALIGKRSRGKLFENQWLNFLAFAHIFY
jgi:hypothetical protein